MACVVVTRFKVQNFETWKAQYDRGEPLRREHHVRAVSVLREAQDPNAIVVLTRFDSVDAAKAMLTSDRWKEAARSAAGSPPELQITEVVDDRTY